MSVVLTGVAVAADEPQAADAPAAYVPPAQPSASPSSAPAVTTADVATAIPSGAVAPAPPATSPATAAAYIPGQPLPAPILAQFAAVRAGYGEAWQLDAAPDGVYIYTDAARILLQPVGTCPDVSSDLSTGMQDDPPLCATFAALYPVGTGGRAPAKGYDPGRTRSEALLKAVYGASAQHVAQQSRPVNFLGTQVLVNARNGVADALERVVARLDALLAHDPAARAFILPTAGTFKWRVIRATRRLSMHSFAVAIDLSVKKGLYWQWSTHLSPTQIADARNSYPQALIDAFEAEGFIWGGKWDAFDLMHFEYRPELIAYARAQTVAAP